MAQVTASIVVSFGGAGDSSNSILKAEIDSRATGLNSGVTTFVAGDSPGFLVYKTSDVTLNPLKSSAGSIAIAGSNIQIPVVEYVQFANEKQASPSYPVNSGFTYTWMGYSLGVVSVSNGALLTIPNAGVGVARITYNTIATPYRLTGIPSSLNGQTTFPVVIYVEGEVA